MTIQTIISKAVKRLKLEGKLLTPDFYAEAFCKEAKKAGMQVEDCQHLQKFNQMLNKDFQKDLKNYNIKTMHEFVRFLISKLNRTNPTQCTDTLESQTLLCKRILQVVSVLHNKEAGDLAQKTLELLERGAQPEQLKQFRQYWVNFLTTYDDTFLQKLKEYGDVDTQDLQKSIENLHLVCASDPELGSVDLYKVSKLLVASFVPSIASSVNDTIANLSERIQNNPALLENASVENEIKSAISLRIALDKESVKEMVESIDSVLDRLSLRLIDMIERSDNSNSEIQAIKKELESYTEGSGGTNFKIAHKKLFTIAIALEENTQLLSKDLKSHNSEVKILSNKVHALEKELETVKQESKEDFLTKLYNKRALDEFMQIKEGEFKRYNRNFAIVMFDIDHFKKVNDTYGHEAGDAVLSAFAKILKIESRTVDVIGRFGGEEFLGLLSETDMKGGSVFAEKVRKHVEKTRFVYKGKRIKVTVSAGVSQRLDHVSLEAAINSADEYMYKAKQEGRNRVEYKK